MESTAGVLLVLTLVQLVPVIMGSGLFRKEQPEEAKVTEE
jgi:hypothetical protein